MTKDLEENYSKAKYHSPQKYGEKLAVVFVDFANAYFDQESPLFGGEGCQIAYAKDDSPAAVTGRCFL